MKKLSSGITCFVFMAASIWADAEGEIRQCKPGLYLGNQNCHRCKICPQNEIVRRPCRFNANTICGAFFEFDHFNQGSVAVLKNMTPSTPGNHNKLDTSNNTVEPNFESEEYWRKLVFVLVGLLCLLSVGAAVGIALACRWKNRRRTSKERPTSVVYERVQTPDNVYSPIFRLPVFTLVNEDDAATVSLSPQPSTSYDTSSHERRGPRRKKKDYVKLYRPSENNSNGDSRVIDLDKIDNESTESISASSSPLESIPECNCTASNSPDDQSLPESTHYVCFDAPSNAVQS